MIHENKINFIFSPILAKSLSAITFLFISYVPALAQTPTETETEMSPDTSDAESSEAKIQTDTSSKTTPPSQDEIDAEFEEDEAPLPPPPEEISVEFYRPEIGDTKNSKRTRVMLSGKKKPNYSFWIGDKKIPFLTKDKKVKYLNLKAMLIGPANRKADKNGLFNFAFDFPHKNIQLTLKIAKTPTSPSQSFQLNLNISSEEIKVTNQRHLKVSPLYAKKYALWFGSGFNYLRYQQESSAIGSQLEFQTFKGPSFFGRGWWKINDQFDATFEAKMSPGSTTSSEAIQIAGGNYNWLIFALEGTYYRPQWTHILWKEYDSRWGVRFGLQHHLVPFISRTGASETEAEVVTNSITMFTLGFQNNIDISTRWAFEWFMRYQYPLTAGNVFQLKPKFGFDGSLGIIRALKHSWKLGLFWYGQWHDYNFTHQDRYLINQGNPSPEIAGHQSLFFSNIELRAGYEFN